MADNNNLHLPNLTIMGFRGIDELSIPRLGRVTLLAGKNSVGKTTVLEAVQGYAARGRYSSLHEILIGREEVFVATDDDGAPEVEPDWTALFYDRDSSADFHIAIGPGTHAHQLSIERTLLNDQQMARMARSFGDHLVHERIRALKIKIQGGEHYIPLSTPHEALGEIPIQRNARDFLYHRSVREFADEEDMPPSIKCVSLGPGLLSNDVMARFWDNVVLTDDQNHVVRALEGILRAEVQGIAFVGNDRPTRRFGGRRVMVKISTYDQPVPLRSLGDGAFRMFGAALALANSQDGFLLIDEVENGIHHSVQRDYWRMVLQTAQRNNVQVIATTHSWDCVRGFAQAAVENEEAEGQLVRLSRQYGDLRAVEYSEEELAIAADQGIEVR